MSETLFELTTEDVEAIIGRPLEDGEASSVRKTLEWGLGEEWPGLVVEHFQATSES